MRKLDMIKATPTYTELDSQDTGLAKTNRGINYTTELNGKAHEVYAGEVFGNSGSMVATACIRPLFLQPPLLTQAQTLKLSSFEDIYRARHDARAETWASRKSAVCQAIAIGALVLLGSYAAKRLI